METILSPNIAIAHSDRIGKTRSNTKLAAWLIIGFMAFSTLLSATLLMSQSLRLDESQSLWQSSHSPERILNIIGQDVHVPLYGLTLHFWQIFFGNSVPVARLFSFVFFLLTIPAVYFLGKKAYSPNIGLFASGLIAISPFLNWYGNEIRMYALLTFLTVANQYFFVSLFRNRELESPRWYERSEISWTLFAVTALLGMYTHYFFAFLLISEGVFYLFNRKMFPKNSLRNLILTALLILAAFVPWLRYVLSLGTASNTQPLLTVPSTINLFNTFSQFMFGFQGDHLNSLILSLWPLSVLLVFLAVAKHRRVTAMSGYFLLCVFLPILLAFVISITFRPLFLTRYLIFTAPSLYLFLGWFLSVYSRKVSLFLKTALVVGMLLTLGYEMVNASAPVKENYEQATRYLNETTRADDVVAVSAPFTIYPIQYYYRGPAEVTTIPYWNRLVTGPIPAFSEDGLAKQVNELKSDHTRIYVILSYNQGYENQIHQYFEHNFHRLEQKNFSPGLNLYVYQLRYDEIPVEQILNRQ